MELYTPNIPAVAEPTLSTHWTKDAESDIVDGVIQIWTPAEDNEEDEVVEVETDPAEAARIAGVKSRVLTILDRLHDTTYASKDKGDDDE